VPATATPRGGFDTIAVTDLGVGSGDPNDPELPVNVQPGPVFEFDVGVEAGTLVFIGPEIAIGYDYAIGAGDPGFRSVLLPQAGDDPFDLFLFDPAGNPFDTGIDLLAGVELHFLAGLAGFGIDAAGLERFGIRGIETSPRTRAARRAPPRRDSSVTWAARLPSSRCHPWPPCASPAHRPRPASRGSGTRLSRSARRPAPLPRR